MSGSAASTEKNSSTATISCPASTGNANPALTTEICQALEFPLGKSKVSRFSDGETFCVIQENVRGVDTYVVQPTCSPVNDSVMELLIMVDALRRASAGSITAMSRPC